jgi:hypothetical protein
MSRTALLNTAGVEVVYDEGESGDYTGVLYDHATGLAIAKAALATLTVTLKNAVDGVSINSRTDQDILDTNGGAVTTAGVVTLKLQPLDNIVATATVATGETETHHIDITWTWSDADAVTRTGIDARWFKVMKLP